MRLVRKRFRKTGLTVVHIVYDDRSDANERRNDLQSRTSRPPPQSQ